MGGTEEIDGDGAGKWRICLTSSKAAEDHQKFIRNAQHQIHQQLQRWLKLCAGNPHQNLIQHIPQVDTRGSRIHRGSQKE